MCALSTNEEYHSTVLGVGTNITETWTFEQPFEECDLNVSIGHDFDIFRFILGSQGALGQSPSFFMCYYL